jgi:antitoxin ParD1/3/4
MNVSLTDEQRRFIQERVEAGRYRTAADVVRDALRVLMQQEAKEPPGYEAWRDQARQHIEEGYQQAERGELLDGEEVFARAKRRLRSSRRRGA